MLAPAGRASGRIESLIDRMTLAEMAGQLHMEGAVSARLLVSDFDIANPFTPHKTLDDGRAAYRDQQSRIRAGGIGFLAVPQDHETVFQAQKAAVEGSRLKIPLMFAADVIHGRRTVFPVPLAEAASWEPELARRTARAAAIEASAEGLDLTFAPMVDIGRDQRWGRVVEGAGEDPLLGALFAAARVHGFQGDDPAAPDSLLACPKHFAAYGAAESGLDYSGADISERLLHEVYLPPFAAAFAAGARVTMAAFVALDGVPVTGSARLLTQVLREEMGFRGFVVSDYASDIELVAHGFAADARDAARLALMAGCDVSMVSGLYPAHLPGLVQAGLVPRAAVAQAVRRVLEVKEAAGLFDDPFRRIDADRRADHGHDKAHRALARDVARRSAVLLKNDGKVLPLSRSGQRIALIGPMAADRNNLDGPWGPPSTGLAGVPIDDGLRAAMADPSLLAVVPGCEIDSALPGGIDAAVQAARAADVVVLALGESQRMSGEASSRAALELPGAQQALAEAVAKLGKPTVVLLRCGRALALEGAVRDAPAVMVSWFLGTETGPALADLLFGIASPSARLPITWPQATGQEPLYYARAPSGRSAPPAEPLRMFTRHFLGLTDAPLYAFGHGLTYSTVRYGPVVLDRPALPWDSSLTVGAVLTNTGTREAEEVAQLYVHDEVASIVRPVRELKAFRKLRIAPGESVPLQFTLRRSELEFVGSDLARRAEPGWFQVWIAPSAATGEPARFELLAPTSSG